MQNWLQLSVCLYIFFFTTSKWWVPSDVGQISLLNKTHVPPAPPPPFQIIKPYGKFLYIVNHKNQKRPLMLHVRMPFNYQNFNQNSKGAQSMLFDSC